MKCSKCHSENTQKLEVVFSGGTHNIETISVGIAGGGNGNFGGVTTTSGQSQSFLAAACAPPPKKSESGPTNVFCFALLFGCLPLIIDIVAGKATIARVLSPLYWVFVVFLSPIWGTGLYLLRSRAKYNKQIWPTLYQRWRESWLCHKCGYIYHQPLGR